jgi:hypothetical protein
MNNGDDKKYGGQIETFYWHVLTIECLESYLRVLLFPLLLENEHFKLSIGFIA